MPYTQSSSPREGISKNPIPSEGSVQSCPERGRREGRSRFDARSVRFVRERERREERQVRGPEGGQTATPGLTSRFGKTRERRWRPFEQTQGKQISFGAWGRNPIQYSSFVFFLIHQIYSPSMSIRQGAGEWEPLLLGIEAEHCGVCDQELYRNTTMLKGGWQRCSMCGKFVHYACLASGKVKFLKRRPRVCLSCDTSTEHPTG